MHGTRINQVPKFRKHRASSQTPPYVVHLGSVLLPCQNAQCH